MDPECFHGLPCGPKAIDHSSPDLLCIVTCQIPGHRQRIAILRFPQHRDHFPLPQPSPRCIPASTRDSPASRTKVVLQVPRVWPCLEVVPPGVGNEARVDDVNLADTPPIEPGFREKRIAHPFVPNLNVSGSHPKPAYPCTRWDRALIGRMRNPADRRKAIHAEGGNRDSLEFRKVIPSRRRQPDVGSERPLKRHGPRVYYHPDRNRVCLAGQKTLDVFGERKIGPHRHRTHLADVATDGHAVEHSPCCMAVDAHHPDLEEMLGMSILFDTSHRHTSPNHVLGPPRVLKALPQCLPVPHNFSYRFASASPRGERNPVRERQCRQSPDTPEPAVDATALFTHS